MRINKIRSALYKTAQILGDINAVQKGKLPQRIVRRTLWRIIGRAINRTIK